MHELHGVLSMGETAEEVAVRYGISREAQDASRCAATNAAAPARTATSTPNSCRWYGRTA